MDKWFDRPNPICVAEGDYERMDLILYAGTGHSEFLKEFAEHVLDYYLGPLKSIIASGAVPQLNMEAITSRLFSPAGEITEVFQKFAGEVLASWAEDSFTGNSVERRPKPHDSTPCFDLISLGRDAEDKIFLRFVQAKTTESNEANNANSAAVDLGKFDKGEFFIELASAVEDIAERQTDLGIRKAILKTIIDPSSRRYGIVIVHATQAPGVVLTNYDKHIRGERYRREASFFRLIGWKETWKEIGNRAYEKINSSRSG